MNPYVPVSYTKYKGSIVNGKKLVIIFFLSKNYLISGRLYLIFDNKLFWELSSKNQIPVSLVWLWSQICQPWWIYWTSSSVKEREHFLTKNFVTRKKDLILKIFGDHSVHKISSPKNHKVNEKISGWPLCQKYLWHFLPSVKKIWGP